VLQKGRKISSFQGKVPRKGKAGFKQRRVFSRARNWVIVFGMGQGGQTGVLRVLHGGIERKGKRGQRLKGAPPREFSEGVIGGRQGIIENSLGPVSDGLVRSGAFTENSCKEGKALGVSSKNSLFGEGVTAETKEKKLQKWLAQNT